MLVRELPRVGYVLKRYPRYSETFIVNEILAHEAAGLEIEIFSLRPPSDTHFQDTIARVRAPVTYIPHEGPKAAQLWSAIKATGESLPEIWCALSMAKEEDVRDVYQSVLLASEIKMKRIGHLHAHFGSLATTIARLASRFTGIPYTFTAHAKDIFHESVQPDDLRRKLADAAATVTVSDYNVGYLHERYGPSTARVRRIYNGLELDKFAYASPEARSPLILAVGRLVEKKGFGDLIEACAILAAQGCEFTCRIIGEGELRTELHEQIASLGLQSRVELSGPRPQSEVIEQMRSAALFAAPCVIGEDSNRDGLPTVLLEAMALGTPCVSTDVTGVPEVLLHTKTGLMVPQHDPPALAEACKRLLLEPTLRVQLASGARRLIKQEFDVHQNAASLRELFQADYGSVGARRDFTPAQEQVIA